MAIHSARVDRYYSAIVGRGRTTVAPSMREAKQELRRQFEADAWGHRG